MALTVLLDSVILIDHLNDRPAATNYLRETNGQSGISVITRAEVLAGFDPRQWTPVQSLLDRFPTFPIDRDVADLAAKLRRLHRWRLPDACQAALAQTHQLRLATRNVRDFPPDKFDFVVVPYTS